VWCTTGTRETRSSSDNRVLVIITHRLCNTEYRRSHGGITIALQLLNVHDTPNFPLTTVSDRSCVLASLQLKWCLQVHSLDNVFQCLCVGDYGLHCNDLFYGHDLSGHLREAHNIHGADKSLVFCPWDGCGLRLHRESLSRHVEERHLGITHRCDTCGKSYSRRDTLSRHMRTCSGP
jgi:hypothetical protein